MSNRRPRSAMRAQGRWLYALLAGVLLVGVAACGTDQPSTASWRNITFDLPDGWYLTEQTDDRLSLANAPNPMDADGDDPPVDGPVVAMHFTYEPRTLPDDWREFVEQQNATLETDDRLTLDGEIPATRLIYSYTTGGIPTREMVVVIPSREVVLLALPVPAPGQTDAPEAFLAHIDDFLGVLESVRVGPPVED